MHMANELLSLPVAGTTLVIAGSLLGAICKKAGKIISADKIALMGIMGAFIFAAQMVNFQLPGMPGTSGHMIGAILMAILLGPHAAAIVISSVVIIQCLIFQDGGLLALGCNIINMAIAPSYIGYYVYKLIVGKSGSSLRIYIGTVLGAILAMEIGAIFVPIQTALSGVLVVPFKTFLFTMLGVHLIVGIAEGLITVAVLGYLQQVRPSVIMDSLPGKARLSRNMVLATFAIFAVVLGAGISLFASSMPDGLEWSYCDRPNQPEFSGYISNEDSTVSAVEEFQSSYSLMPDYSKRVAQDSTSQASAGWTSFAGVIGSFLTMAAIWFSAWLIRRSTPLNAVTA